MAKTIKKRRLKRGTQKRRMWRPKGGGNSPNSETSCKYLSPRGIMKSCTVHTRYPAFDHHCGNFDGDYNMADLKDGATVYVRCNCLGGFLKKIENLKCKLVIVTGDNDCTLPNDIWQTKEDFFRFLEKDTVLHFFAQNLIAAHPKATQLPIGLDYHTLSEKATSWGPMASSKKQEEELESIIAVAKPFQERVLKCYSNAHLAKDNKRYTADRNMAMEQIPEDLVVYEKTAIPRMETWKKQVEYAFVVAPHGNGLDCHRQWEALCLGCIPIVKTSELDRVYDELPVLIVKEWSDVNAELLKKTVGEFSEKKFKYEKLLLKYWLDRIASYSVLITVEKPKSVAMFFVGRIKHYTDVEANLMKIKAKYNPTFFCSLNKKVKSDYIKTFCDKFGIQDSQINLETTVIPDWVKTLPKEGETSYDNTYSMFYHMNKAFQLIEAYQTKNKMKFDCVLLYRADMGSSDVLQLELPLENTIYIPLDHDYRGLNDQLAYGSFNTMKKTCECVKNIQKICKEQGVLYNPEAIYKKHIMNEGLNISRFKYVYSLLDSRNQPLAAYNISP